MGIQIDKQGRAADSGLGYLGDYNFNFGPLVSWADLTAYQPPTANPYTPIELEPPAPEYAEPVQSYTFTSPADSFAAPIYAPVAEATIAASEPLPVQHTADAPSAWWEEQYARDQLTQYGDVAIPLPPIPSAEDFEIPPIDLSELAKVDPVAEATKVIAGPWPGSAQPAPGSEASIPETPDLSSGQYVQDEPRKIWPYVAIGAGVVGLVTVVVIARRRRRKAA